MTDLLAILLHLVRLLYRNAKDEYTVFSLGECGPRLDELWVPSR